MNPTEYFSCPRLRCTMRIDRCNEQRAAGKQLSCKGCTNWQQYQSHVVQVDVSTLQLSPPSESQLRTEHRTSVRWKPDLETVADINVAFSYRPLPMPSGYTRAKLERESGVSTHAWERYFAGSDMRIDAYERAHGFLRRLYEKLR